MTTQAHPPDTHKASHLHTEAPQGHGPAHTAPVVTDESDVDTTGPRTLFQWTFHVLTSLAVIAIIVIVTWVLLYHKPSSSTANVVSKPPAEPTPVQTVTIAPSTVPVTLEYLGQTEPYQRVEIRSRVAAYLQERLFEEGSTVKKDQLIFKLEPDTFEADVQAARAAVAQAQATLAQARRQVARFTDLVKDESATIRELEDWQTQFAVAQATELAAKARLRQTELNLGYTQIRSPLTGRVGRSSKDIGSYVNPQTDSLLTVVEQIDPLYILAPLTEKDLQRWSQLIKSDKSAEQIKIQATLQDGSPYPYLGTVAFIDVRVQPRTGTAIVRAKLPNPDGTLVPGQLLRVRVVGLERKNVITVPQKAVIQSPAGASVYTISDEGKAVSTPVVLGDWLKENWVIESGLKPGQRVITDHLTSIRPGADVVAQAGASHELSHDDASSRSAARP